MVLHTQPPVMLGKGFDFLGWAIGRVFCESVVGSDGAGRESADGGSDVDGAVDVDLVVEVVDSEGAEASAAGCCVDMLGYSDSGRNVDRFECKA
jgi:hypothetical protein